MDLALAIARINPAAQYRLSHSGGQSVNDIIEWRGPGSKPTQAELDAAWAQLQAEDAEQQSTAGGILSAATGAVGKTLGSLSSSERNALLAVVLHMLGAVDRQGKVRPLGEWAGRD